MLSLNCWLLFPSASGLLFTASVWVSKCFSMFSFHVGPSSSKNSTILHEHLIFCGRQKMPNHARKPRNLMVYSDLVFAVPLYCVLCFRSCLTWYTERRPCWMWSRVWLVMDAPLCWPLCSPSFWSTCSPSWVTYFSRMTSSWRWTISPTQLWVRRDCNYLSVFQVDQL